MARFRRPPLQGGGNFIAALGQIFRAVVKPPCARVLCRCFCPRFRFASRLDCIANVFAIAERRFSQQTTIATRTSMLYPESGRVCFAADVKLYGAIDSRNTALGRFCAPTGSGAFRCRQRREDS